MAADSHRKFNAIERKNRKLISDSLLNHNYKIRNLLNSFYIEEELPITLSEEKVSITEEEDT